MTRDLTSDAQALRSVPGVQLVALFGPEHGYHTAAANGAPVGLVVDVHTGLPVYSLYGETRRPTPAMLAELDALIFDIQSVGVRFYTFITTLLYAMQAAAEQEISFIVCDRPNPVGGKILEGPILESGFESFIGPGPLPIRYALTVGELALLYNTAWEVGCNLTVVPCAGWRREMWFDDTGLPWIPPSPAMPWPDTAIVYPGTCLIEGTNLSEGRGTALPFHLVGARWIDEHGLAKALNQLDLPGVRFRSVIFEPATGKWAGQRCCGVQLHITDRNAFRPVSVGLHLLATVQALYPEHSIYLESGEGSERVFIDLLIGTPRVRQALNDDVSVADLIASWADELDRFAQTSHSYRLYD